MKKNGFVFLRGCSRISLAGADADRRERCCDRKYTGLLSVPGCCKNNHRRLICSDLKEQDGVYSIDFEDFERKIEENNVKLFILCST